MKIYKNLTEIYRKAIIETQELTYDEAQANCHNLIVDLDAAYKRGEVPELEYRIARKEYEKAFGKIAAKVNEAHMLMIGYRLSDDNHYMTVDGTELPFFDIDRFEEYVNQDISLKREAAEARRMKEIYPDIKPPTKKDNFPAFKPKGE